MAPKNCRAHGPADSSRTRINRSTRLVGVALALGLAGCVTYEPAPLDISSILDGLDSQDWESARASGEWGDSPVEPVNLAAFAVSANPTLVAARSEVGVAQALLVEAGLLPDPELGWDAMDLLASRIVDGTSGSVEVLSGFGLMFPLQRPGERDARVGAAEWRIEETRRRLATAEWNLTRDIFLACEEVHAAEELRDQTRALSELAASTRDYFGLARDAGTATGIQANLAQGELLSIQVQEVRAEVRLLQAKQSLNSLLGLPPDFELGQIAPGNPFSNEALQDSTAELTELAIYSRPDLAELEARYQIAEEDVRLAVSAQYPQVAIGTGISLSLPVLSQWGRPAIDIAVARREQIGGEFRTAVHAVRQEIAAAHTLWKLADRELSLIENELLPNAEENLELAKTAFLEGEITLLETLALQSALVEARTRFTEGRAENKKRAWTLLAASGQLLAPLPTNETVNNENSK